MQLETRTDRRCSHFQSTFQTAEAGAICGIVNVEVCDRGSARDSNFFSAEKRNCRCRCTSTRAVKLELTTRGVHDSCKRLNVTNYYKSTRANATIAFARARANWTDPRKLRRCGASRAFSFFFFFFLFPSVKREIRFVRDPRGPRFLRSLKRGVH